MFKTCGFKPPGKPEKVPTHELKAALLSINSSFYTHTLADKKYMKANNRNLK